jgi:threonine/homoserine/homoserine lactone efflux protein
LQDEIVLTGHPIVFTGARLPAGSRSPTRFRRNANDRGSSGINPFVQGLVLGFSIAVPVGPIGVLSIRRSVAEGALVGFLCGLGAATADATYAAIGAAGLTAISEALVRHQFWLRLPGGGFLCYLGAVAWRSRPAEQAARNDAASLAGALGTTLLLTLSNPLTILSFVGLFAGMGFGAGKTSWHAAVALVAGVFAGSAACWLVLSLGSPGLGSRLGPRQIWGG